MRQVYVGMCADIIHAGHVNLLRHAAELGRVTVGLITDEAIARYKAPPAVPFESRRAVIAALRYVDTVVEQDDPSPVPNLMRLHPDIFVHGDDWQDGELRKTREAVVAALARWGGRLEEVPYTPGISSSVIKQRLLSAIRQRALHEPLPS